jgi:acyl-CoA thioesterase I
MDLPHAPPRVPAVPHEHLPPILCIGDSLTAGYGVPSSANFPSALSRYLGGRNVINAGVNGDTSAGCASRLPDLLSRHKPSLVLVNVGGNDFMRGVPIQETKAHLARMASAAKAAKTPLVFIAEPAPDIFAALKGGLYDHPVYAEVARETRSGLYAGGWVAIHSRPDLLIDPIHANPQGYALFAERLSRWLSHMKLA